MKPRDKFLSITCETSNDMVPSISDSLDQLFISPSYHDNDTGLPLAFIYDSTICFTARKIAIYCKDHVNGGFDLAFDTLNITHSYKLGKVNGLSMNCFLLKTDKN